MALNQDFTQMERLLIEVFQPGTRFNYKSQQYKVIECDKPRPKGGGECKTDVYIKASKTNGDTLELKLSVKKSNADFLENKISIDRAKEIFGNNAQDIIKKSTTSIRSEFEATPLIYYNKSNKTEALSITLGWKFELMNKASGGKSGKLILTDEQKIDVYAGTNLPDEKKNSLVKDIEVKDSGVANYYFEIKESIPVSSFNAQYVIDHLEDIENYAKQQDIYFACKALNYRLVPDKWDGDRPLSVYVEWINKEGKLYGTLNFENPLSKKGNEIGNKVHGILVNLGVIKPVTEDSLKKVVDSSMKTI